MPKYAWSLRHEIPPNLRNVLVTAHGLDDSSVDNMIHRRQAIPPKYLAYWTKKTRFFDYFLEAGIKEEQLIEIFRYFSIRETIPTDDATGEELRDLFKEKEEKEEGGEDSTVEAIPFNIEEKDKENRIPGGILDLFVLPDMLHITTDYCGDNPSMFTGKRYKELNDDVLSPCSLHIIAIYSDRRGVGVLVGYNKSSDTPVKKTDFPSVKDPQAKIPKYKRYTSNSSSRNQTPHITLVTNTGREAKEIGIAAYEFESLLNKWKESVRGSKGDRSQNSLDNLDKKEGGGGGEGGEGEIEVQGEGEEGGGKTIEPTPLMSASDIDTVTDPLYTITTIGGFRAVIFEKTVRFKGTFAYRYTATNEIQDTAQKYAVESRLKLSQYLANYGTKL